MVWHFPRALHLKFGVGANSYVWDQSKAAQAGWSEVHLRKALAAYSKMRLPWGRISIDTRLAEYPTQFSEEK